MADRLKYSEVRQRIIDDIRTDLIGPREPKEVLTENPRFAYLVGMLDVQHDDDFSSAGEQEVDADMTFEDGEDFTAGEDDDNEPISTTHFQLPSSIGISFYIHDDTDSINLDISWGDYVKSSEKYIGKDEKEHSRAIYTRQPMKETIQVVFSEFSRTKDYQLVSDSNVHVHVSRINLKGEYSLVTAYVVNKRNNPASDLEAIMFQVEISASAVDGAAVFVAEHICRGIVASEELYFEKRPIMGRGRGCAAVWDAPIDGRSTCIKSAFIPEYEFPGVSAALDGFDANYFSTFLMSVKSKKVETIEKLNTLADSYENWINSTLLGNERMKDSEFQNSIGNMVVERCLEALKRIREGIHIIEADDISYEAFCFMNRVIFLQNSIKKYAKKHGEGKNCSFQDFINPKDKDNSFGWRPFQIAFILMNLAGIVDPKHRDREVVDLLYFPTGGGKTEAYLGLIAFVIANRRLRATNDSEYNYDGGVTVMLRYTLRLLTTQQRDRITKMVIAAELIRRQAYPQYGKELISIGFWVGGKVTPNKFKEFNEKPENPQEAKTARNHVYKQLLTCPFCGTPLKDENFNIDVDRQSIEIYCSDKDCEFYRYKNDRIPIPVYLVDEEIYGKCPTIILSTVDKFAGLPWDVRTNSLFGRVNRKCSRDGYVAIGEDHKKHNKTDTLPTSSITEIRPFLPPELIIQDELHLITGPLGTVYGAYETIIEEMCTHDGIKPKYVVSTATIKNAEAQTKCLYARNNTTQFPPNGFEIGDSFFIREIPIEDDPFRKYVGVCAPGQSVKTALLRVYAIILESAYKYSVDEELKDFIDPYYTLVGYYNSIRELGGAVRLLQDDIPKRMKLIQKRFGMEKRRPLYRNVEITSRMSSYMIPEKLNQLEAAYGSKDCLDTAIATNMIAVGMDVDRLGLMVVTGQPKQNSEYIQATSRIGRAFPGLVVTLYNAYRPRDLSHYENFTGYHSQLYRFVEGTTATPFSARARDRVLHALIISAIRLTIPNMANNKDAADIASLTREEIDSTKRLIIERLNIIKPSVKADAEEEIDRFIDWWKLRAAQTKPLSYYVVKTDKYNRLMNDYNKPHEDEEKPTLRSMREVESSANMFYYTED
mgnify:CR=1 FL=1